MKNKLFPMLGLLCAFVVSEPACKKDDAPPPKQIPAVCQTDLVDYQTNLNQDIFIDQFNALKTGDLSGLASAIAFEADWASDDCPTATGIDPATQAKIGLLFFYRKECDRVRPSKKQLVRMLLEAEASQEPIAAQMYMLGVLCTNVNEGNDTVPSVDIPSNGTTL